MSKYYYSTYGDYKSSNTFENFTDTPPTYTPPTYTPPNYTPPTYATAMSIHASSYCIPPAKIQNNLCVESNLSFYSCQPDQTLVNGLCYNDIGEPTNACSKNQILVNGLCYSGKGMLPSCQPGQTLIDGMCYNGIGEIPSSCESNQILFNGLCYKTPAVNPSYCPEPSINTGSICSTMSSKPVCPPGLEYANNNCHKCSSPDETLILNTDGTYSCKPPTNN